MSETRWTLEDATAWRQRVGWRSGCNFTPSTAGNQFEMWQDGAFDTATIERELSWAADWGMNTVRVYLHDQLYLREGERFLDKIDEFLSIAAGHGISTMPVLFDGVWNPEPSYGPQPEPRPRLHNSIWMQSPGRDILYDESRWSELRPYVRGVIERFGDDDRIVAWDLFNEPDQVDVDTLAAGDRNAKARVVTRLVDVVFDWARSAHPRQPLTVGLWEYDEHMRPVDNDLNRLVIERSDVISFHCYEPHDKLEMLITELSSHGRPLVCTEWLARTNGSTADLIDVMAARGVDAINWGLVDGRTQTRFPWRSWWESVDDDEPWFHELIHADGRPYDDCEKAVFQESRRLRSAN